jgi:hypothetical protein
MTRAKTIATSPATSPTSRCSHQRRVIANTVVVQRFCKKLLFVISNMFVVVGVLLVAPG